MELCLVKEKTWLCFFVIHIDFRITTKFDFFGFLYQITAQNYFRVISEKKTSVEARPAPFQPKMSSSTIRSLDME